MTGVKAGQDHTIVVEAIDQGADRAVTYPADAVIAADGIRSPVRNSLYGTPVPLATNGWVMYRGVTTSAPFLTGRSMVIIGDETQRVVVYPIADGVLNWLLVRPKDQTKADTELGNWNVPVSTGTIASFVKDYRFDWLDVHQLWRQHPKPTNIRWRTLIRCRNGFWPLRAAR